MPQFMLILNDDPAANPFPTMSPQEMQAAFEKFNAWGAKLAQAGQLIGGDKLKDEGGRQLSWKDGKAAVVDGPYAEAKEVVGGYYIIQAENYDHAVQLCLEHPHLEYGGTIAVRETDPLEEMQEGCDG